MKFLDWWSAGWITQVVDRRMAKILQWVRDFNRNKLDRRKNTQTAIFYKKKLTFQLFQQLKSALF